MPKFKRILVPVDGSDTSNRALAVALQMAQDSEGARVRILHALDELAYLTGFEYSGELVAHAREKAHVVLQEASAAAASTGVEFDVELVDQPGQKLGVTVAKNAKEWDADLIVLGSQGRSGLERLMLGSGADQVIRRAPVPVMVVPPAGR